MQSVRWLTTCPCFGDCLRTLSTSPRELRVLRIARVSSRASRTRRSPRRSFRFDISWPFGTHWGRRNWATFVGFRDCGTQQMAWRKPKAIWRPFLAFWNLARIILPRYAHCAVLRHVEMECFFAGFAYSHMNLRGTYIRCVAFACRFWLAEGSYNVFAHLQPKGGMERPPSSVFAVGFYVAGQPTA